MGGGDPGVLKPPGELKKEAVAHLPGRLLDAPARPLGLPGHVAGGRVKGDAATFAPGPDKGLVAVGIVPPEVVVVVGGVKGEAPFHGEPQQQLQKAHGIYAPGDAGDEGGVLRDPGLPEKPADSLRCQGLGQVIRHSAFPGK